MKRRIRWQDDGRDLELIERAASKLKGAYTRPFARHEVSAYSFYSKEKPLPCQTYPSALREILLLRSSKRNMLYLLVL